MYSLNLLAISLELAREDPAYEDPRQQILGSTPLKIATPLTTWAARTTGMLYEIDLLLLRCCCHFDDGGHLAGEDPQQVGLIQL